MKIKQWELHDFLSQVGQFHSTFNHPIKEKPDLSDEELNELRIDLIEEELEELKEALNNKDVVATADALCDLQYVLSGAVLALGYGDKFMEMFQNVQNSNMSKVVATEEEAIEEVSKHLNDNVGYEEVNNGFILKREDGKVMKPSTYKAPTLGDILNEF